MAGQFGLHQASGCTGLQGLVDLHKFLHEIVDVDSFSRSFGKGAGLRGVKLQASCAVLTVATATYELHNAAAAAIIVVTVPRLVWFC